MMADRLTVRTASVDDVHTFVDDKDDRRYFVDHLGNGRGILLFAFLADDFVGQIFLRLEPPEEPELRDGLPDVPLIQHFKVLERYRNQGIGTRLIGEAERRLSAGDHDRVALAVHPDNVRAIKLYVQLRFALWRPEPLDTFHEHVGDDGSIVREQEPCLVYVKTLGG
jgi:ribosomal protein S18 acetylase RimI-like enzyme